MNLWNTWETMIAWISPATGDKVRPWLAAVILIVSIIVLVVMLLVSRRSGDNDQRIPEPAQCKGGPGG